MFTATYCIFWTCIVLSLGCIIADYLFPIIGHWIEKRRYSK